MLPISPAARPGARKKLFMAIALAFSPALSASHAYAADDTTKPSTTLQLAPVAVTANPLGVDSDALVTPVSVLSGRELSLQRESTLGETLKSIPGVSSSYFGPNASRPVIRGLDNDRVRIMQNGVGILDASALSPDHAVALDPLVIEQIDVVRGPAALLYGGSAVGGVVNAIDHRIPKEAIDGVTGRGEVRLGGADNQKSGAAVIDAGNGVLTLHADAYERKTDDMDIPCYAVSRRKSEVDGTAREDSGRLVNSAARSDGGALGASVNFDNGYAGLSFSDYNSNYGTVAEKDVRIDMDSQRWDFASEFRDLGNIVQAVKVKMAHTDYQHQEIEDGAVGTTFRNRGLETAIEARHGNIGLLSGVVGLQLQNSRFQALGEEAFIPKNSTDSKALYVYEELPLDALKLSLGGRAEQVDVDSNGGGKFGPAVSRDFAPRSAAFGALYALTPTWSLVGNLSHNERAPSYNELYANGAHVATAQYEIGNSNLDVERSNGVDTQLRWKEGKNSFSVGAFYTRFSNFITLNNTGRQVDEDGVVGGDLTEAQILQVPAIFKGLEGEGKFRVYEGTGDLDLTLRGDYVRATNRDTGEPLPRIAPLKLGFGFLYQLDRFGSKLDVLHAFKQDRTADAELATNGYTQVNLTATYRIPSQFYLEAFAKAYNLLNEEIRDHTSYLKDIAPMGGRSIMVGLRGAF